MEFLNIIPTKGNWKHRMKINIAGRMGGFHVEPRQRDKLLDIGSHLSYPKMVLSFDNGN